MTTTRRRPVTGSVRPEWVVPAGAAVAALAGVVVAYLIAGGQGAFAVALLAGLPIFYLIHRSPLSVVALWLLISPYLIETQGGALRRLYWVVHRALPLVVLVVVLLASRIGLGSRRLARVGWPEVLMGGYLAATVLSVLHESPDAQATLYLVYDRVFVPMCLYLIVRLLEPDEEDLRRLLPVVVFLLITQALYGMGSVFAPEILPGPWVVRGGVRATGSLGHPNVYTVSILLAGLLALNHVMNRTVTRRVGWLLAAMFPVALIMTFLTHTRASWLAAIVVLVGVAVLYPRIVARLVVIGFVVVLAVAITGVMGDQAETAQARFRSEQSEESALSRLPVVYASFRMFGEKPLQGWGYGNFDMYDREFQGAVGGLVVPRKDHASHNLYLTILAEQGLVGLVLYLGPAILWLAATPAAYRRMPATGLISRRLLVTLWLALAAHVVVNNFANMRIEFGLGGWWLTLGMVGSLVARYRNAAPADTTAARQTSRLPVRRALPRGTT